MQSVGHSTLRLAGGRVLAVIALLLLPGGAARADGARASSDERGNLTLPQAAATRYGRPAPSGAGASRFVPRARERILTRVGVQLETLASFRDAEPGRDIGDQPLFEEMSREVRRSVEREARRAVKNYLVDVTDVDRVVERLQHRGRPPVESAGPPAADRKLRFDVGIHRLSPEIEMRYGLGRGAFKFSVDARGAVAVQYRDHRMTHAHVVAGFDGDDAYRVHLRIGF